MKKYIERLQNEKTPHERRQFAMRVAGVMTAFVFVGWVATLGVTLSQNSSGESVQNTASTLYAVQEASTTIQE